MYSTWVWASVSCSKTRAASVSDSPRMWSLIDTFWRIAQFSSCLSVWCSQNDRGPLAMGLLAFFGLGCMQVCAWMYHFPVNQGCKSTVIGVAPASSTSWGKVPTMDYGFCNGSSSCLGLQWLICMHWQCYPNTVDWSPSLWGRGSSLLIRLPSFSLMQLFDCLESHVVYYTIMMSTSLLHFGLVCGQFLVLG